MKKRYIQAQIIKRPEKKDNSPERQDKIARIYAMAAKLHVKIGGRE